MITINPKIEEFLSQIAAEKNIPLSEYADHVLKVGLSTIYKNNNYKKAARRSHPTMA